jgi:hypothetical protein
MSPCTVSNIVGLVGNANGVCGTVVVVAMAAWMWSLGSGSRTSMGECVLEMALGHLLSAVATAIAVFALVPSIAWLVSGNVTEAWHPSSWAVGWCLLLIAPLFKWLNVVRKIRNVVLPPTPPNRQTGSN